MTFYTFIGIMVFALGACVGSFANVCILRIPAGRSIIPSSQCPQCGSRLKWYELIPIASYIALRGKCRRCKDKISLQYPLVEGINGILWLLVCIVYATQIMTEVSIINGQLLITHYSLLIKTFLYCIAATILLIIAIIDHRTMEIPPSLNIAILIIGALHFALDIANWHIYLIGAVSLSGFLLILWLLSGGRALGGGDIKLMAVCGLLLGWKLIIIAFLLGCIIGSIVHLVKMIIFKAGRVLAFGPYLAAGVFVSMLWGSNILDWYVGLY